MSIWPNGAHKSPEFLKLNPLGQVPVLEDGDVVIADSIAIMTYVAKKLGATDWLPEDAEGAAKVQKWLSVAAGQIAYGVCAARLITVFQRAVQCRGSHCTRPFHSCPD
ncbi:glutathione S-transferase family protein [Thalassospira lucentensis]|uniref:glutathione S-transferase family protein n=1 Tax=Thalassospira lucentensis TaxID=168935 RepID=UPI002699C8B6